MKREWKGNVKTIYYLICQINYENLQAIENKKGNKYEIKKSCKGEELNS